ncbi:MAG: ferredoxin [Rhodobacteraceae bacterium]|nr:ferredoxin [Paracoccaceae bacterium]
MSLERIEAAMRARGLALLGGFHPEHGDDAPEGCRTLLLLGPDEPGFWPEFTDSAEWRDGQPDPMDRWSRRVIDDLAAGLGARALYPFAGPPFLPFFRWAERTGRIHASPIRLLVHDRAGLFVSFRGALAFDRRISLPETPPSPCVTCASKPCLSACPVAAFDGKTYDVTTCRNYLDSDVGADCMRKGCKARRACPVSAAYPRLEPQSAYHMAVFQGRERCVD